MWDWDDVPVTICSTIEGWHLEALNRRNPHIATADFQARMLDSTPFVLQGKSTTLTNRTMRFRARSWNTTWRAAKASSRAHSRWLRSALPKECIEANSTQQVNRDPTEKEEKELESFNKRTEAEKLVILAQREKASAALLRPQAGMASSSVVPTTPSGSANNPRKRQRRDSVQSTTSEDFSQAISKRRRLQTGPSERRDNEQVLRHNNPPVHNRRRQHNSQLHGVHHGDNEFHRKDEDFSTSSIGHHQGTMPSGYLSIHEEDHRRSVAVDAGNQDILGHTQQRNSQITYDDYNLDPDLDPMDNADDAPSHSRKAGNATCDQPRERMNLEVAQPEAGADDIEYINDIQNAPAGFWGAVNPAAHQGQVEHVSLSDEQRKILNTFTSVPLEVGNSYIIICLDDRRAVKGFIDASSTIVFDQLAMGRALQEIAQVAFEPNRNTRSQKAKGKEPVTNAEQQFRSAYLPVDKDHILVCIEKEEACRGVTAADGETLWNPVTLEDTIETLGDLLMEPGFLGQGPPLSPADRTGLTQEGESASILSDNQGLEDIQTENHTPSVQEELADLMTSSGGTPPGTLQELESHTTIQAANELSPELPNRVPHREITPVSSPLRGQVSVGSSKSPRAASPATDIAYAGNVMTNAASSTALDSTLYSIQYPFRAPTGAVEAAWAKRFNTQPQPTEEEQGYTSDAETSLARAWEEWTEDDHYRAMLARHNQQPVIKSSATNSAVGDSSGNRNGLTSEIDQSPFSRPSSPTSSDSSLPDKLPDVDDPAYPEAFRKYLVWAKKRKDRMPEIVVPPVQDHWPRHELDVIPFSADGKFPGDYLVGFDWLSGDLESFRRWLAS